jgi:hypothetical protein
MSWHMDFVAKDKGAAKARVDLAFAPDIVKGFLKAAIDGLPAPQVGLGAIDSQVVSVKSTGHLATDDSYSVTTQTTEVRYIDVLSNPNDSASE